MWPADLIASLGLMLVTSLSASGAILGISIAGRALAGAGTERPEILTRGIICVVLAEAIAIYGLLTALLIVFDIDTILASTEAAYKALTASVTSGASGLAAGVGIGYSGAAMVGAAAEKPETFSKNVISIVLAEAIAIYGLLVALLLIFSI